MNLIAYLHSKIELLCPIIGLSIADINNKDTWRIDYDDSATPQQKAAAQSYIENLVIDENLEESARKEIRDEAYINDLIYKKAYHDYKITFPNASFSDFMDYMETFI